MPLDADRIITLDFKGHHLLEHVDDPIQKDLSTVTRHGDSLFFSCDETAGVDRLTKSGKDTWGNHEHFNLGEMVDLPAGPKGEMDIEGLSVNGDWLWVCGSHGLKRDKPKLDRKGPKKALKRLSRIDGDENRYFIGRFPLKKTKSGMEPCVEDGDRKALHVRLAKQPSKLKHWLRKDDHIAAFLDLPCKENGFDIEGLAVKGNRLWLGLRGPVLRGHALIIELEMKEKNGFLKAKKIDGRARYRKHFMELEGQGIRDLTIDGQDLLILTGPTMDGDGASDLFRWKGGLAATRSAVHPAPEKVCSLPYRGALDHPEGITAWSGKGRWLVVYDSPAPERLDDDDQTVTADIFRVPKRGSSRARSSGAR
ncbi:DUF3616 domain-containing protein [Pelagovum pacificum]|uniref:DUF3616 domain-containing protein n=1 Tax=Pelagovum pacificum TaxID=2588711 RepID=UPI0018CCFD3A|nr:DUF3616 domain-containing protein [Pelagovum pacificum]QQA41162.1 DUF3616 domain-containing protein [Pelagovum pacificum]